MKVGTRIVGLIVVMITLSLALPSNWLKEVEACSCAMPGTVSEGLEQSDVVFDGIVDSKKLPKKSILGTSSSADETKYTFTVNGSWKGEIESSVTVFSAQSSSTCGYEFEVGKRYVVFGHYEGDKITVSLCSATTMINDSSPELQELGSYEFEYSTHTTDEPTTNEPNERTTNESNEPNNPTINEPSELVERVQSYQTFTMVLIVAFGCLLVVLVVGLLLYRMVKRK